MPVDLYFVRVENNDGGHAMSPYPVYNEDLADVEFALELLGSNGHRVKITEAPVDKQEEWQPHVFIRTSSAN